MKNFDFEFTIPLKRDDLLSTQTADQYYVSEVYIGRDLELKLKECETSVNEDGCDFIFEHFPTLFSVLQNFNDLDFKVLQSFCGKIIVEGLTLMNNTLSLLLEDEDLHADVRMKLLNIAKMLIYVAVEFLKSFQEKVDKTYSLVIDKKGKKNSKLLKLKEEHNWDWEENERLILNLIYKTIKMPLHLLWDPPSVEKEFVRIIEDCCFSVLEKSSVTSIKMKTTREIIFEILGVLITRYNNAISCRVKIVQMLKLYDHLASILAQAVIFFVEQYNCRSLIKELIVEIIETGSEMDTYAQESSSSREFSAFVVEIATQKPELILPCMNLLLHNLNCDPYSMRICVLTVMSEIIIHVLHMSEEESKSDEKNLLEEKRKTRNSFLEHLLDHITDVNVYVRSRVLKLWQEMYKQKVVPKHYVILVLEQAIQRLKDKSSNVVKYAMQLISTMLENNLYGPVLDEECVKQNLRAIKSKIIEAESASENPSAFKIWYCIRSEISEFIEEQCKDIETADESESEYESDSEKLSKKSNNDDAELAEMALCFTSLKKFVIERNFVNLFSSLVTFEEKYLKKAKMFKNVTDIVQYYQWILGNMCKDDDSVLLLFKIVMSEDQLELKYIINQAMALGERSDEEFGSDRSVLCYCEDFLKFMKVMHTASSVISQLMMRNSVVEVLEAVEYFKVAQSFQLSGAEDGMLKMLLLIDSKEPTIKEAVNEAFKSMYLMEIDESKKYLFAVDKLIALLKKVTHDQKKALKNLIVYWVQNNIIGNEFLLVLWDKYSRKLSNTSSEESRAAAVLITMYASAKPEVIKSNIDMLIKFGLCQENRKDYAFLLFTCEMFRVLCNLKNENGILIKFSPDSELMQRLIKILDDQFFNLDNNLYPGTAMEIIAIIYRLSEFPDVICAGYIKDVLQKMKNSAESSKASIKEEYLVRFIIIVGHIIFCEWQYLENDVLSELLRRNNKSKSDEIKLKEKPRKTGKKSSGNTSKTNVTENSVINNFEDDSMAVVNERIAESIRMVCENEILREDLLFGKISFFIVKICQNLGKYKKTLVPSAASIALSKMMMISSEFCNQYMQLFVTILEKTEEARVKMNLILAFGDLTLRFPNTTEPWTGYFYLRLKDDSPDVRYTALLVISHLITNEMVKVKGQMSDIALCIIDTDPKIKRQAYYLFYELSTKGNSLYNVMPDIISRLSHPDHRTSEENFQIILKILMNLIGKDRQLEGLVEKLCHRLRGASDERHCIDLSYCLTLVPYTDRSIQKLVDNIACFADKLNCAKLHKHFTNIIIACKKSKLNKMADVAVELEAKIDIILTKGIDNLDADFLKPPKTPMKTPKTPRVSKGSVSSTRKLKLRASKRRTLNFSDESDSASE